MMLTEILKKIKSIAVCLGLFGTSLLAATPLTTHALEVSNNARFMDLVDAVFTEPYEQRPTYKVNRKQFGKSGDKKSNHLFQAARRTLTDSRDLLEFDGGQKLVQANGICFTAQWRIHQPSDYTGLFAFETSSPAMVRASVALGGVLKKHKRAFGLAVKLLPDDLADAPSLNIFTLNSMGGVVSEHTLDLAIDNEPPLGRIPNWGDIPTALRMKRDLERADKEQLESANDDNQVKPRATFRPISQLAAYRHKGLVRSPKWLRFSAQTQERIDADDFRDELSLDRYPENKIIYNIEVADDNGDKKAKAVWKNIGELLLSESVTSKACDTQLHFQHPSLLGS